LSGKFDLIYKNANNKLVIIDYKSDIPDKRFNENMHEKYCFQMWLYSEGLKRIFHENPEKVFLYFVRKNELQEVDITQNDNFKRTIELFKEFIKKLNFEDQIERNCGLCKYQEICI
jgi:CRISPR/Cas system-associated exonuclease Cas4 (RecB family)